MQNSANTHLKKTNFGVVSVNFSDENNLLKTFYCKFFNKNLFKVLRIHQCVGVQLFIFQFIAEIFVDFGIS